jgi:hypothetical protein
VITPIPNPDARFAPRADVHAQSLFGEAVLLDVASGVYFGLNEVGTRIWTLLGEGLTVDAAIAALGEEFEAEPEAIAVDVATFVRALEQRGLVDRRDGGAAVRDAEMAET